MQDLSRLVTQSLVRHGFDRPLDYRRLLWSRWFRCESHHSLLQVPSQPGVFALAEEIPGHVGSGIWEGHDFSRADQRTNAAALAAEASDTRRFLAVTQFFDADDMAFTLDRMLAFASPWRARLNSGTYFIRYVVVDDSIQRCTIWNALNQWIADSASKASGVQPSSLDLSPPTESVSSSSDVRT